MPLTFPNVMEVGVTPVSEAVLPAEPAQSAASEAGAKLNPADDGAGAAVGAAAAAAAVCPGVGAAVAPWVPPVEAPVLDADVTAPPAAAVVVVTAAAEACWDVPPFAAPPAPRYGLTRAPHDAERSATAMRPARPAAFFLPTTFCPPGFKASRRPHLCN